MIKFKCFNEGGGKGTISTQINKYLDENKSIKFIDVKFSTCFDPTFANDLGDTVASALLIYEETARGDNEATN